MSDLVVVPHTEHGLRRETHDEVMRQHPSAEFVVTPLRDPFAYATLWRRLWRTPTDLVVVEQDVVPPADAIPQLLACSRGWCTHPHWTGEHYDFETFGLIKLSLALRLRWPLLMDHICARSDPRYWVRRGWTALAADCSVTTLNRAGSRACLRPDAPQDASSEDALRRPTTHGWMGLDVETASRLHTLGHFPHHHMLPTQHLHDYETHPSGSTRPWFDMEYDEVDWPG